MKTLLILLIAVVAHPVYAQKRTYDTLTNMPDHYLKRVELFEKEPIQKNGIIMVGNSITEGANWRLLLNDTTVINRGISGDVTFGVLNRIKDITDRKPSKVFILIGINDLSCNTPDEVIIENIFNIIGKIHRGSSETEIFVQSILPTNESFENLNINFVGKGEHIITINNQLKKYPSKMKYTYVDLYSDFLDADGRMDAKYSSDGLHLNAAGYDHWITILKKEKYL